MPMPMLKRHENALMTRFDEVSNRGWSVIQWWEAYLWYGAERLGKGFWRDLRDRFHEENEGELYVYPGDNGLLLIHNDRLMTVAEKLGKTEDE